MAASHPEIDCLSHVTGAFLDQWRDCLEQWLETGAAAPSASARLAVERLMETGGMAEWPEACRLADNLLHGAERTGKAAALLDLMVWLETAQRLYDAELIECG